MSTLRVNNIANTSGLDLFANSKTADGYQKLPGGLIIQWGSVSGNGSKSVTYPVAFPAAVLNICATIYNGGNEAGVTYVSVTGRSTTGCSFFIDADVTPQGINWIAIGY